MLGASGAIASLHLNGEDVSILGSSLDLPGTPEVAGALNDFSRLSQHEPLGYHSVGEAWLDHVAGTAITMIHVRFRDPRGQGDVVLSGIFDDHRVQPDQKWLGSALSRCVPMVRAFTAMWQQNRAQQCQFESMQIALDTLQAGIFVVDDTSDLIFVNAAGAELLAHGRLLRRRGARLTATRLADTLRLQGAVADAIAVGDKKSAGGCDDDGLLRLSAGSECLIAAVISAPGSLFEAKKAERGRPAAVLVVIDPEGDLDRLAAPVCRLFGLSSAETKLACHIIAGRQLGEASRIMRIKEQTARSYLKQVFQKTGVNRQPDLVRMLLSSLVPARPRFAGSPTPPV
jgi:DNA-binding CsgD family transcriptional regulator/PAS domain-containing protein